MLEYLIAEIFVNILQWLHINIGYFCCTVCKYFVTISRQVFVSMIWERMMPSNEGTFVTNWSDIFIYKKKLD